ncbi:hypothetical protein ACFVKB_47340 [Rhodococcus sp. NPDC127530]|uniref:hypothetical protein n=1 Tax=unclassified Rhodococcus (in: high G+C Gram-positive bacteria) TaxID=192944 RepID=UPI0036430238
MVILVVLQRVARMRAIWISYPVAARVSDPGQRVLRAARRRWSVAAPRTIHLVIRAPNITAPSRYRNPVFVIPKFTRIFSLGSAPRMAATCRRIR